MDKVLTKITIFTVFFLFIGCCNNCPIKSEDELSQSSPEDTFYKMKMAIECDDSDWAWNTLSTKTRNQLSYTEFLAGWVFYQDEIGIISKASIISSEPWDTYPLPAQKVTFATTSQVQAFLFVQEEDEWFLEFPSPWQNSLIQN